MDENGDVLIENNEIQIVVGESLVQQKVRNVLSTKLKEWFLNWNEGIDYGNVLGKGITDELVRYEIERGLAQVDQTFSITEFTRTIDGRKSTITFKAVTDSGEVAGGEYTWD